MTESEAFEPLPAAVPVFPLTGAVLFPRGVLPLNIFEPRYLAMVKDAMAAIREVGPAGHFLGTQHTLEHFEKAFFIPSIMDFNSFEQWSAEGSKDHDTRGRDKARALLAAYEEPKLDPSIAEGLRDFIARREEELPNSVS